MDFKLFFAKRLKSVRTDRGYTQVRLGTLSGVSSKLIAKYETGVVLPNIENLKKLTSALGVCADFFLYEQATMEGVPQIKDPILFERYFILEELEGDEKRGLLTLLDSLIARKKLRQLTEEFVK